MSVLPGIPEIVAADGVWAVRVIGGSPTTMIVRPTTVSDLVALMAQRRDLRYLDHLGERDRLPILRVAPDKTVVVAEPLLRLVVRVDRQSPLRGALGVRSCPLVLHGRNGCMGCEYTRKLTVEDTDGQNEWGRHRLYAPNTYRTRLGAVW